MLVWAGVSMAFDEPGAGLPVKRWKLHRYKPGAGTCGGRRRGDGVRSCLNMRLGAELNARAGLEH